MTPETHGRFTKKPVTIDAMRWQGNEDFAAFALTYEPAASTPTRAATDAETLAQRFHEAYERLAPQYGYETREGSSVPWEHVPIENRALMIATCAEVLRATDLCERCHMPATGSGLAFSDGTICNEPRHAGSVPSSTTATPLSEEEIEAIREVATHATSAEPRKRKMAWAVIDRFSALPSSRALSEEERERIEHSRRWASAYGAGAEIHGLLEILDRLTGAPNA
jgi:hypothetical protein